MEEKDFVFPSWYLGTIILFTNLARIPQTTSKDSLSFLATFPSRWWYLRGEEKKLKTRCMALNFPWLVIRSISLLRISPVASERYSSDTTCFSFLWSVWVLLLMSSCLRATPGSFQGLYLPLYSGMTSVVLKGPLGILEIEHRMPHASQETSLAVLSLWPFLG